MCTLDPELNYILIQMNATSQALPYDFASIMNIDRIHRGPFSVAIPAIPIAKSSSVSEFKVYHIRNPSDLDYLHVKLLYCGGMNRVHINDRSIVSVVLYGSVKF